MQLLLYIFFCFFLLAPIIYGNDKIEKLKENLSIDPDISSFVRIIEGRHTAIFQAFQSFEIDIKLSAFDDMHFFYASKYNDTAWAMMKCENQCFLTYKTNDNEKMYCEMGYEFGDCYCYSVENHRRIVYDTGYIPDGYGSSNQKFDYYFKLAYSCPSIITTIKDNQQVIRAQINCMDIKYKYNDDDPLDRPTEKCIFGLFSFKDPHPFFNVKLTKSSIQETDPSKALLYYPEDVEQKAPSSNISFTATGWPRIQIQPNINAQRFVLLKPDKIRNFPGFIFDYDDRKCNNVKQVEVLFSDGLLFSIRFFDRDDCTIYIETIYSTTVNDPFFTVSAITYGDDSQIKIKPGFLSDFIMYYNSPYIRFSDHTVDEFYQPADMLLCEHEVDERFVIEVAEASFYQCPGFGLITGPEVVVEVPRELWITTTPTKAPLTTTTTVKNFEQASMNPLIIACLTIALLLFIAVINFFLIRRKWFKESQAVILILDIFSEHWQFVIPPPEPIKNNNNDDEIEEENGKEQPSTLITQ